MPKITRGDSRGGGIWLGGILGEGESGRGGITYEVVSKTISKGDTGEYNVNISSYKIKRKITKILRVIGGMDVGRNIKYYQQKSGSTKSRS